MRRVLRISRRGAYSELAFAFVYVCVGIGDWELSVRHRGFGSVNWKLRKLGWLD